MIGSSPFTLRALVKTFGVASMALTPTLSGCGDTSDGAPDGGVRVDSSVDGGAQTRDGGDSGSLPGDAASDAGSSLPAFRPIDMIQTRSFAHLGDTLYFWGNGVSMPYAYRMWAPVGAVTYSTHGPQCGLMPDGAVHCGGTNATGRVGDGTTETRMTAVPVLGVSDAVQIATGLQHGCALRRDGTVFCWGEAGTCGVGDGMNHPTPAIVLTGARSIAAGTNTTCAVIMDGTVRCWGQNDSGQVGDGTTMDRPTPATVMGLSNVARMVIGERTTCAFQTDGSVTCWGLNDFGQAGDGTTMSPRLLPVPHMLGGIRDLAVGANHACVLTTAGGGTVTCYGANDEGQLGDGTTDRSPTGVTVMGINTAEWISVGGSHSCALLADETLRCWGANGSGQLGDGTTDRRTTPVMPLIP